MAGRSLSRSSRGRRPPGRLESEILAALWAAGRPLTPREVQRELGSGLAYTTVMTTLTRLHEKGVATRETAGRAYAYAPVLDRDGTAAARMRDLLDTVGDREAVLSRFVGSLPEADEQVLAELLRRARGKGNDPA